MIKDDCIFCKIANGEIPSYALYDDNDFKIILDIEPSSKGHSLIIPKSHASNLFDLDDNIAQKALPLAKKAGAAMQAVLNCDGINVLQNNGSAAGQTVDHYHIHLIPRYNNDNVTITWAKASLDKNYALKFVDEVNGRM